MAKIILCNAAKRIGTMIPFTPMDSPKEEELCHSDLFIPMTRLGFMNKFETQNGNPQILQQPVWQCLICGTIKTQEEIFNTETSQPIFKP
jgi:hypothetical protein